MTLFCLYYKQYGVTILHCMGDKLPLTLQSAETILLNLLDRMIWSWYTGRWYIWHSEEGTGRGRSPPRPLLTESLYQM